jgi:hypothetical protein
VASVGHAPQAHQEVNTVIYVEYHDGPEQTEAGRIDWQLGWYATCDECGWLAGPCPTEADAHAAADAHDLAMGEATPQKLARDQHPGGRVEVAWQVSHGRRSDGWWFAVQVPGRPLEEHGPFVSEPAMLAAKLTRMQQLDASPSGRPAVPGERCTCGRQAVVIYLGSVFGPTGYCGIADGGDQSGPCPFCGGPRHETAWGDPGRCPDYRLRLDQP